MIRFAGTLLMAVLAGVVAVAPARGQDSRLLVEARGGVGIPVGTFVDGPAGQGELDPDASFGVRFLVAWSEHLTIYAGFSQDRFGCADDGCPGDQEYVSTGWEMGARWFFTGGAVAPWLSLGIVVPRVERDFLTEGGELEERASGTKVGGEGGFGVRIRLADRIHLDPSVRLVAVNSRFEGEHLLQMRYAAVELGVLLGF